MATNTQFFKFPGLKKWERDDGRVDCLLSFIARFLGKFLLIVKSLNIYFNGNELDIYSHSCIV